MRLTTVVLGVTCALAAVKARCSAPPPLRGADGLDAGAPHARPGSCLTMTNSPTPASGATTPSRNHRTLASTSETHPVPESDDNGCCTTSQRGGRETGMQLKSILKSDPEAPVVRL